MKKVRLSGIAALGLTILLTSAGCQNKSVKAADSITEAELRHHLEFLASDQFRGRRTPSPELKIASLYLAAQAEEYGLKPVMPDGSWFQELPLAVTEVVEGGTRIRLLTGRKSRDLAFPDDFGIFGRGYPEANISGRIVFAGYGLSLPAEKWDDLKGLDLKDKIVVYLDPELPPDHRLNSIENPFRLRIRMMSLIREGAAAVLRVINRNWESRLAESGSGFDHNPRFSPAFKLKSEKTPRVEFPYFIGDLRHDAAAAVLGISREKLEEMFETIRNGRRVEGGPVPGRRLEISIETKKHSGVTHNVVAMVEGTDPSLRDQYVLLGAHHDHLGVREGQVFNGADDNGSGTVAMLEIAQALMIRAPRRTVIFVWHAAEESGLLGSFYFVENCPVPLESISAELNMDMLCRNDPDSLYLVGSNKLSSELDAAIHKVNDRRIGFKLDYAYEDPSHPKHFFFRSDHYPYIRFGIPAAWFFCGTTDDYHRPTDDADRADYGKMARAARLVYWTALEIGNSPEILKLDLHPDITSRGEHNLAVEWR